MSTAKKTAAPKTKSYDVTIRVTVKPGKARTSMVQLRETWKKAFGEAMTIGNGTLKEIAAKARNKAKKKAWVPSNDATA